MTFSNSLPVVDRKLIGRKFWGSLGSLPGFGKVMTLVYIGDVPRNENHVDIYMKTSNA
jgi:hypothetical protein